RAGRRGRRPGQGRAARDFAGHPAQVPGEHPAPLAYVRGTRPGALQYGGAAKGLRDVWVALRASLRGVLEAVTLADLAAGELPDAVTQLTNDPDAWASH